MIRRPTRFTQHATPFPDASRCLSPSSAAYATTAFSDPLARQPLADHVELVERREFQRQRALPAAGILDRDADPQQFGQVAFDRDDIGVAPDAVQDRKSTRLNSSH